MQPETILFACSDDTPECIALAREWVREKKLTADDVRMVKRDGMTLVIAKRECNV
jgi:hypothetical protein